MKLRGEFTKLGNIKYISHLDLMRVFSRAFQRGNIPVLYSEGFNPHPLFTLGNPLSLGVESESEFLEIEVEDHLDPKDFKKAMNEVLPEGIRILRVYKNFNPKAIQQQITSMKYTFTWEEEGHDENGLDHFLNQDEILITRKRKKGRKKIEVEEDVKDRIFKAGLKKNGNQVILWAILSSGENTHLRPDHFLQGYLKSINSTIDPDMVEIKRVKNFTANGEEFHG
ncbi:MAG: TIGR03936 family radical SAM-associated protein [Tissierellia bacterium]|nr:TIGR03936 family radical SAM-associated protein [Tissierellia bacterium]